MEAYTQESKSIGWHELYEEALRQNLPPGEAEVFAEFYCLCNLDFSANSINGWLAIFLNGTIEQLVHQAGKGRQLQQAKATFYNRSKKNEQIHH